MHYKHAIVGGTFDHFHAGHLSLLKKAFEIADRVTIGITTSDMYQHKYQAATIENYDKRHASLVHFLKENGWLEQATILPIKDKYGSILTDPTIEAIIVSPETEKAAGEIVQERQEKRLSAIEIIVVPFVKTQNGLIVSSENIRKGIIDREGNSYLHFFQSKTELQLPDALRTELQQPIGHVTTDPADIKRQLNPHSLLISVGDIVTTTLLEANINPDLAVVDFRTRREDIDDKTIARYFPGIKPAIANPAGTINPKFAGVFLERLHHPNHKIIRVDGEEDLLTLPVILLAPLGTTVLYGQFEAGMVLASVTEELKRTIKDLLQKFEAK